MVGVKESINIKVDISKKVITLDDQKISEEIIRHECINDQIAYLFINGNTMKALANLTAMSISFVEINIDDCIQGKFKGRKIFKNDDLEFGEIEIR